MRPARAAPSPRSRPVTTLEARADRAPRPGPIAPRGHELQWIAPRGHELQWIAHAGRGARGGVRMQGSRAGARRRSLARGVGRSGPGHELQWIAHAGRPLERKAFRPRPRCVDTLDGIQIARIPAT